LGPLQGELFPFYTVPTQIDDNLNSYCAVLVVFISNIPTAK
jgi:hypothetical protein